ARLSGHVLCHVYYIFVNFSFTVSVTYGIIACSHNGKSNRCVFKEVHTLDDFTGFQSAANDDWYIGFRRNGKPLKGFKWQRRRKRKNRQRQRQRRQHRQRHKGQRRKRPREKRQTQQTLEQQQQQLLSRPCYQFIKTDFAYLEHAGGDDTATSEWGPKGDFSQILKRGMT
ncbi:hypothetical protein LSAT2_000395, partial [Lamellibrachia satsuma]